MKARSRFVSNSSSSSFILLSEGELKTVEDVQDEIDYCFLSSWNNKEYYHEEDVAQYLGVPGRTLPIHQDNRDFLIQVLQEELDSGEPLNTLLTHDKPSCPEYITDEKESRRSWNEYREARQQWANKKAIQLVDELLASHSGEFLHFYSVGDDDKLGSAIEHHIDWLNNFSLWIRISHH